MKFEDISSTPATLSEAMSQRLVVELLRSPWRCYQSTMVGLDLWIDTFLRYHARVPGIVHDIDDAEIPVYSEQPLHVLRFFHPGSVVEGVVYTNGAVVSFYHGQHQSATVLLIADADARYWDYPHDHYVILSDYLVNEERETDDG